MSSGPNYRVALYSHDTMGLGHMRRNLLIAQALAESNFSTSILIIAGARELNALAIPPRVECLTLPSFHKELNGNYNPRSLDVSLKELIELRSQILHAALKSFAPDVFIVDKEPRGALGELNLALSRLRKHRTRCVLGLRDVLDEPEVVRREWRAAGNLEAIRRHYDAIWVYGDPAVYDPIREYGFPKAVAEKVRYTGYLDQRRRLDGKVDRSIERTTGFAPISSRLALCMVGGGQDGGHLAETFSQAQMPGGTLGVIITGPFMPPGPRDRIRSRAAGLNNLEVVEFLPEPDVLLNRADHVVAMGGYNTVCDILSFGKRALIVPRTTPRREQFVRAERLRSLGLLEVLPPDRVSPKALSDWLAGKEGPMPGARGRIDLSGTERLPRLLEELVIAPLSGRRQEPGTCEEICHVGP